MRINVPLLSVALFLSCLAEPAVLFPALGPGPEDKYKAAPEATSPKNLPLGYRTWLEEEVVYIITETEKDVFLQLTTDRDRDIFIKAFWKQRDPRPETEANEFKDEHFRRLAYVKKNFERESAGAGWRSAMGRIYIILGEPRQIMKYENLADLFPTVIWFYNGMEEYGLPSAFSVVFFKKNGMPPYVLYSPVKDGPQNLLIHYITDALDYRGAYNEIMNIEPNIGAVSLSLIEGESQALLAPSIASEILVKSKIPAAPTMKVNDEYAGRLLRFKDIVEVEYTANYIHSDYLVRVFQDDAGAAFIHYLIEPQRLSLEQDNGLFRTEVEVNGHVSDDKGRTVYQFERRIPVELTGEQVNQFKARLFSYQDLFPMIPGRYKLSLLWKNRLSHEFTSFDAEVNVPDPGVFTMNALLLGNRIRRFPESPHIGKSFLFGNVQILPSPHNDFVRGGPLYLFFQLRHIPQDIRESGVVSITILKDEVRLRTLERNIRDYNDPGNILEEFQTEEWEPAYYRIRLAVLDGSKAERISIEEPFYIPHQSGIPRPWVMSLPLPPPEDAFYPYTAGIQYVNTGQMDKARPLLKAAHQGQASSPEYALGYARCLFQMSEPALALEVMTSFLADDRRYAFLELAGRAAQTLEDWGRAIRYYKEYLAHFGTHIEILNDLGECFLRNGENDEALLVWGKSLELNPKQPGIEARIKKLKENREIPRPFKDGRPSISSMS